MTNWKRPVTVSAHPQSDGVEWGPPGQPPCEGDFNSPLSPSDSGYWAVPRGKGAEPCDWWQSVKARMESLAVLEPNWDKEGSPPPVAKVLEAATEFVRSVAEWLTVVAPKAFPTRTGGIQLVWKREGHHLEIDFVSPSAASFIYLNKQNGIVDRGEVFVDDKRNVKLWRVLVQHFAK